MTWTGRLRAYYAHDDPAVLLTAITRMKRGRLYYNPLRSRGI